MVGLIFTKIGRTVKTLRDFLYMHVTPKIAQKHDFVRLSSGPTFPTFPYFFALGPTIPTFLLKFLLFPTFPYFFCQNPRKERKKSARLLFQKETTDICLTFELR